MMAPGSAGVPPAQSLAQPRPSPPLGSTGNGAMALLRPGRCGSRRQGGCLQHRTEAQRRPKGQDAGGTPALPGVAVPAVPWGVSGGRLLRKPTCTLWETPVCPRAGRQPGASANPPSHAPPTRVIPHSPAQRSDSSVRRSPGQWTIMLKCAALAGGSTRPSIRSSDP